jgi:hypothetical protein
MSPLRAQLRKRRILVGWSATRTTDLARQQLVRVVLHPTQAGLRDCSNRRDGDYAAIWAGLSHRRRRLYGEGFYKFFLLT